MASCENKTILVGYVCSNVDQIDSDPIGVKFKIKTDETFFSKKHQKYTKTSETHFCKTWKKNALFALKNLSFGDYVYVLGKVHYHIVDIGTGPPLRNPEIIISKIIKLNREQFENNNKTPKEVVEETDTSCDDIINDDDSDDDDIEDLKE
jgi:single-stranded DNA-binding protein